jgi:hypothetical protein
MKLSRGRKAVIILGMVVFLVGSTATAGYALWDSSDTASGGVSAATIGITANGASAVVLSALNTSADGQGVTATTSVAVKSTGSLALAYTTTLVAAETPSNAVIGDNITYTAWITGAASNCTANATVGSPSWTGTLGTGTKALGAGRSLASGATEIYCVRTKMSATAPTTVQGQSVTATLNFAGSSGTWGSTATASFTQSSATVPSTSYATCVTDLAANSAMLTWPAAPATLNGSAFVQYYLEWIYTSGPNSGTTILTTTRTTPYAAPSSTGLTGNSMVRVTYRYANGWTSNPLPTYAFVPSADFNKSPVCSPEMP